MLENNRPQAPVIFVCGKGRSGNTLVGRVLSEHPDVTLLPELHFFGGLWSPRSGAARLPRDQASTLATTLLQRARNSPEKPLDRKALKGEASRLVSDLPDEALTPSALFREFLSHETRARGKVICCEQDPRNVFFIREILDLYPDARVVVVVRDPRGVLSVQKDRLTEMIAEFERKRDTLSASELRRWRVDRRRWRVNSHPILVGRQWRVAVKAGEQHAGDERVFVVRFEDVVGLPRELFPRLCDFLGIAFDESMLDVAHIRTSYELKKGSRGLVPAEASRWSRHLGPTDIFLCQLVARRAMKRLNYEPVPARPNPLEVVRSAAALPFNAAAALALNRSYYYQLTRRFRR